jgi:succinyl-CoA--D-citramalate CoA-transferase
MISAFPLGDFLAGVFGAFGALAAIVERYRSGKGQVVDVSLFEPFLRIIESAVLRYDLKGELKPRMGNQMEEDVPRNIYETSDARHYAVSVGPQQAFEGFADAMQMPELKSDTRFSSLRHRVENRDAIDGIISTWSKGMTLENALAVLTKHGVVVGPVNSLEEVVTDPHVIARRVIERVLDPDFEKLRMVQPVPRLSDTPGAVRWTGKAAGAANDFIYSTLLNFDKEKLDRLEQQNII